MSIFKVYSPSNSTSGCISEENENTVSERELPVRFMAALPTTVTWGNAEVSGDGWVVKRTF